MNATTEIDPKLVKQLREKTNAGFMDCKRALVESAGDLEKAETILRTKGIATAAKKATRAAKEGIVASYIHLQGKVGVLVEVNCETDFVARNENFREFVKDITLHIAAAHPLYVNRADVPGNLIDPVAAKLIQMFPLPTQPIGSTDDLSTDWFGAGTNSDSSNQFDIKIDHRLSESKLLSGKYAERRDNSHSFNCFGNAADPCTGGPVTEHDHLFALNYTQTFSPTLVMNLSYGLTRGAVNERGITGDFPNLDPVTDLGFPAYMDISGFKQYPSIRIGGYDSAAGSSTNIGTQTFSIIKEGQETHTALASLNWVRGNHELKFGAEMRVHRINFAQPGWPAGQFRFDATGTSEFLNPDADTGGDGMASFLIGVGRMNTPQPNACNCPYEVPNNVATQNFQFGGFVQDNFRITPKLTLNLGVRYEISLPRTERFNRMNWLDPNLSYSLHAAGLPDVPVKGGEVFANSNNRYNYDTYYGAIQPRLGFAWELPHTTVLRGGYGIYFLNLARVLREPALGATRDLTSRPNGFQVLLIRP